MALRCGVCPRCDCLGERREPVFLLLGERRELHERCEAGVAQAPSDASLGKCATGGLCPRVFEAWAAAEPPAASSERSMSWAATRLWVMFSGGNSAQAWHWHEDALSEVASGVTADSPTLSGRQSNGKCLLEPPR